MFENVLSVLPLLPPIFIILSISVFFAIVLNRKVTETIIVTIAIVIVILFLFGLLNFKGSLLVAYLLLLCFSIYSSIFSIKAFIVDMKKIREIALFPSLSIFFAFFLLSLFLNYKRMYVEWDEFSFWGSSAKIIYSFNALGTLKESTLVAKSYIPGMPLLAYFFTRFFKEFVEFPSYIASNILFFSIIMIFIKKFNLKNFLFIVSALLLPLLSNAQFYSTLYVDCILGVMFGSIFLIYYNYDSKKDSTIRFLSILSICALMSLFKDMGSVFALISILVVIVDVLFFKKDQIKGFLLKTKNKSQKVFKIFLLFSPFIFILMVRLLWMGHVNVTGVASVSDSIGKSFIPFLRDGKLLPYQNDIMYNFLNALKHLFVLPGDISFYTFYKVSIVVLTSLLITSESLSRRIQKRFAMTFFGILVGNLIYLSILLFSYIFVFSQYEGTNLASYGRYMSSYILGLLFSLLVFLVIKREDIDSAKNGTTIKAEMYRIVNITVIFFLFTYMVYGSGIFLFSNVVNARKAVQNTVKFRMPYGKISEWSKYTTEKEARIYIISQADKGFDKLVLMHMISPSKTEWITDYSVSTTPYYPEYPWTKIITPEEWGNYVTKNYDLVYIFKYDENFVSLYGRFFDSVRKDWLYKVNMNQNGELKLISLEKD